MHQFQQQQVLQRSMSVIVGRGSRAAGAGAVLASSAHARSRTLGSDVQQNPGSSEEDAVALMELNKSFFASIPSLKQSGDGAKEAVAAEREEDGNSSVATAVTTVLPALRAGFAAQHSRRTRSSARDLEIYMSESPKNYRRMIKALYNDEQHVLDMSARTVDRRDAKALSHLLLAPQFDGRLKLRRLHMVGSSLRAEILDEIVRSLMSSFDAGAVTHLVLAKNSLGDVACGLLGEFIGQRSEFMRLQVLNLNGCGITSHGLLRISEGLAANTSLRSLSLANNDIGDNGVEALADDLKDSNRSLRSLCLANNVISGDNAIASLAAAFDKNHVLARVELDGCLSDRASLRVSQEALAEMRRSWSSANRPEGDLSL